MAATNSNNVQELIEALTRFEAARFLLKGRGYMTPGAVKDLVEGTVSPEELFQEPDTYISTNAEMPGGETAVIMLWREGPVFRVIGTPGNVSHKVFNSYLSQETEPRDALLSLLQYNDAPPGRPYLYRQAHAAGFFLDEKGQGTCPEEWAHFFKGILGTHWSDGLVAKQ